MISYFLDDLGGSRTHAVGVDEFQQKLPFYVYNLGLYRMGERYYTKRDGLNNYLLIYTLEGQGRMTWNGGSSLLEAGSVVLIDCNIYHEYETVPGEKWIFYYVHFGALSMEGFRNTLLRRLTPVMLRSPELIREEMEKLYQTSYREETAGFIMLSNILSNILTEMVCSLAENQKDVTDLNRTDITELAGYIRTHYCEDLHIEDFMKYANLSRHYLIHVFERQMGMPPYRYLHMCRINQALALLRTTELSIAEIAERVGYSSAAVFIRHFKSFIGLSPGLYRNESIRA